MSSLFYFTKNTSNKLLFLLIIILFFQQYGIAQQTIKAVKTLENIKIDGRINEVDWGTNLNSAPFTQESPNNGELSLRKTEVAVLYNEHFLYILGVCYVDDIEELNKRLTERDNSANTDFFGVQMDPFGNAKEGYDFTVTAAGVQADEKLSEFEGYADFNAVWESEVAIYDDKWVVEMKIPFNSIRFPENDLSQFKINFQRNAASLNEVSFWSPIDANVNGFLNQFGALEGVKDIATPLNLALYPFAAVVSERIAGQQKLALTGGVDLKYVHKNAFTLDVSLIPDFSQTQSDDQIFNISPFEVRYNENRQFFIEGTELFDKGGYLYTRRIGGQPLHQNNISIAGNEAIIENPSSSNVISLLKLTGKTKKGLSAGILNGLTAKSEAVIKNMENGDVRKVVTAPLTNYNAFVLDKTFKNNSSISLVNHAVLREGQDYDANLTAFIGQFYTKKRTFSAYLKKAVSQKYEADKPVELGHQYFAYLSKISGRWTGGVSARLYDEKFQSNDFGFLNRNNQLNIRMNVDYNNNKPKKVFSRYFIGLDHSRRYYYSLKMEERSYYKILGNADLKKSNHTIFYSIAHVSEEKDFYEPRTKDRYFKRPGYNEYFLEYQTNRNKNVFFAGYFGYVDYLNSEIYNQEVFGGYGLTTRLGGSVYLKLEQSFERNQNSVGFLKKTEDDIVLGERDLSVLTNTFTLNYSISKKINLLARARHYWIEVDYNKYYNLTNGGDLEQRESALGLKADNFNAFSIDVVAKWQFAPGSELRLGYKLGANHYNSNVTTSYFNNLKNTFKEDNRHTFSIKMIYFLDANRLKLNRKRK